MKPGKLATYSLCLGVGGALALFIAPRYPESQAYNPHAAPELVLSRRNSIHDYIATLSEQLEDGSARLQQVLEATSLLLDTLRLDMRESREELKLPLVSDGEPFGYLRVPAAQPDGSQQWVFEFAIPALARYGDIAAFADFSIAYFGTNGTITKVSAFTQASVHKRAKTVSAIGSQPYLIGGALTVDASSSNWYPITLTVEAPDNTHVPVWTSMIGDPVQGEDRLGAADISSVAAILFSL